MKRIVDYFLSILYMIHFGATLAFFHLYQVVAFHLFGRKGQKIAAEHLNFSLTYGLLLTGASIKFRQEAPIPTGRPIIFVANHQSTYDIPGLGWFLRKYTPIFVSKIELAHGIPSVSYNLRKSQAALINRQDRKQAVSEILRLGKHIQDNNYSAVIFPEGTRTQSGIMKPFAVGVSLPYSKSPLSVGRPRGYSRNRSPQSYERNFSLGLFFQTFLDHPQRN